MKGFFMKPAPLLLILLGTFLFTPMLAAQESVVPDTSKSEDSTDVKNDQPASVTMPRGTTEDGKRTARNSIWAELLGSAYVYSVNYERLVTDVLGIRAGISVGRHIYEIPITVNYIGISSANKKHAMELGGGGTFVYDTTEVSTFGYSDDKPQGIGGFGTVHAGYRFQPADGGFCFRVGATALIGPGFALSEFLISDNDPTKWGVLPWAYISWGGSF
jgi:hypothetical protein